MYTETALESGYPLLQAGTVLKCVKREVKLNTTQIAVVGIDQSDQLWKYVLGSSLLLPVQG